MIKEGKNKKTYKIITKELDTTLNDEDMNAIQYVEKHYPSMAKAFQEIQFEQYELFCRKQYNYGKSNIML